MGRKDEIIERVRAVAEPLAAQEGLELVDVQLGGSGRTELTLFIDKRAGAEGGLAANMPADSDALTTFTGEETHSQGSPIRHIDDEATVEAVPLGARLGDDEDDDTAVDSTSIDTEPLSFDDGEATVVEAEPLPGQKRGVTLDDCANFSRIVSAALDVEDPLDGTYELVVSSPGIDRPLRTPEHFERYKGQRARVKTYGPIAEAGNRKTFVGNLLGYDAARSAVLIDVDGTTFAVPHQQISKANLDPIFEI